MHAVRDAPNGEGLELDGTEQLSEQNSPALHLFDRFNSTSLLQ